MTERDSQGIMAAHHSTGCSITPGPGLPLWQAGCTRHSAFHMQHHYLLLPGCADTAPTKGYAAQVQPTCLGSGSPAAISMPGQ
jgi:hypothetical protein